MWKIPIELVMQDLKNNYLLLKDLKIELEVACSLKYYALLIRQLEKLQANLLASMKRAIEKPSRRTYGHIKEVAIQDSRLLAKRLRDAKHAGEIKEAYEEIILDFYQRLMVKTGIDKEEIRSIWLASLSDTQ